MKAIEAGHPSNLKSKCILILTSEISPYGRSKSEIRKMDAEELMALDMHDDWK
jgi:hypothetical protein